MNPKPLILALGEILWDLLPTGKQLGGAPANFAYHAAQLGADARTISAVGNDDLGREILDRVRNLGLETAQIAVDRAHPTSTVTVALDPAGQPSYIIHENVAWDFIASTEPLLQLASKANCVCYGTLAQRSALSRQTIHQLLAQTRPDTLRIFDINLRQHYYNRDIVAASLGAATVLKINDQELPVLYQLLGCDPSPAGLFQRFNALKFIALTRGSAGAVLYSADGQMNEHPGHPAHPMADAVGAGDAFTGMLATGLLANWPLDLINDRACRLASYVCTQQGATPPIPALLLRELGL